MISVIIPSRGESAMLWATVVSIREDLKSVWQDYEIMVIANEVDYKLNDFTAELKISDLCTVVQTNSDSPHSARMAGFQRTSGEIVFFSDAHCIFPHGFFKGMIETMEAIGADAVFGGVKYIDKRVSYGCKTDWDGYNWSMKVLFDPPYGNNNPFPIITTGHGVFCVRREVFNRTEGYWLALKGFGGEETQWNTKAWMMGFRLYMIPSLYHWHFLHPGARRGQEIWKDRQFVKNFLLVAAAYGDREQVEKAYEAFRVRHWANELLHRELVEEVLADGEVAKEKKYIRENAKFKSIEELRRAVEAEGIM